MYIEYIYIYIYILYLNSIDLKRSENTHSTDEKWSVAPGRHWMPRPATLYFFFRFHLLGTEG